MSILSQISSIFSGKAKVPKFIIYTNRAINVSGNQKSLENNEAITFNTIYDFAAKSQISVAYEPLEGNGFSSNSIQGMPDVFTLTCIASPLAQSISYTNMDFREELGGIINKLYEYKNNSTLLVLLSTRPMLRLYSNLKLIEFDYEINPEHTNLRANLKLQEIRIVTSSQYGTLPQNQVSNPANSSKVDNGIQTPKTVDTVGVF